MSALRSEESGPSLIGGEPRRAPQSRRTTFSVIKAVFREVAVAIVLAGVWLIMAAVLLLRLMYAVPPAMRTNDAAYLSSKIAPVILVCALPAILMACFVLVVGHSLSPRIGFILPKSAVTTAAGPASSISDAEREELYQDASDFWRHEARQVETLRWRIRLHGAFYGFSSSLGVILPAAIVPQLFFGPVSLSDAPPWQTGAIAVAAVTLVAFTRDFSRMLVRAANRDSSTQMFAWATKRLFVLVAAAVLLACLEGISDLRADLFKNGTGYVLMGVAVAVLGDQGALSVTERVARVFGAKAPRRQPGEDLQKIDGLEEEDIARLMEDGIDSVHSLAFYSTPKLFFSSPYPLTRICDWQDQALLMARLGDTRARAFREQLLVRGAIDAQNLAREFLSARYDPDQKRDVSKLLGLSDAQAAVVMTRLADDAIARKLRVFREAVPRANAASNEEGRES